MAQPPRANPEIFLKLRSNAFAMQLPMRADRDVSIVLMDWNVSNGVATVLASADGSASVYLSSGGGFIGGGQGSPAIRAAALQAIATAEAVLPQFEPAANTDLPTNTDVTFYVRNATGLFRATVQEERLRTGNHELAALGNAMQGIISQYRLWQSQNERARQSKS